jgi:hypothetical protein
MREWQPKKLIRYTQLQPDPREYPANSDDDAPGTSGIDYWDF